MSRLSLKQAHSKPKEEVREVVEELSSQLRDQFGMSCDWAGDDQVNFHRKGVDGTLKISDSDVAIDMKLGLLMGAFKPKIKEELQRTMAKYLS